MAKKQFKKVLSMGLSLVMCASLTVPAFAANFADLNNAINGTGGVGLENGWTGYGKNDKNEYDIWAKGDNNSREIQLQGSVTHKDGESSITIDGGKNVTLDLNGNIISNGGTSCDQRSTIYVKNGELTLNDSHTGDEAGQITGGQGSGIWVDSSSTLTMNGGTISGNYSKSNGMGGGVHVEGRFTMNGGTISGNHAAAGGGGVYVSGTFNMNGGTISNNHADENNRHGGGVHVSGESASFTMTGGTITGNTANAQGGGVHVHEGTFTMSGGTISDNTAQWGGGVNTWNGTIEMTNGTIEMTNGTIEMTNGTISGNHAIVDGSDVWVKAAQNGSASFTMNGNSKINGSAATDSQHVVVVQVEGTGNSTFTMNDSASLTRSDDAKADILVRGTGTVNYGRGDNGGLLDVDDKEAELEQNVEGEAGKDISLSIDYPAPVPSEEPENPGDETGDGTVIEDPDVPLGDEPEVEIEDPAVPLASGPITRAEFIDYLWRHEGEPASAGVCTFTDVPEDHVYVLALAWAEQNEVAFAYEDGTFEPDELVTVGAAREFLTNFENVFGRQAVAAASLKSLTGADDEAVLNCDEVLAEFFGEAYVPAKEDDVEIAA